MKLQKFTPGSFIHYRLLGGAVILCLTATLLQGQTNEVYTGAVKDVGEQFREVHNQIHEIQLKASESPPVKKAQEDFSKAMDKAMIKADPEVEETITKSNALLEKIRSHPEIDNPQAREQNLELKKMLLDYRFLEQKLTPARRKAAESPECKEKYEKLQEVTLAEMKKINPKTQQLMDRKTELTAKYRELRSKAN